MNSQMYKIYINGTPLQLISQDFDRPESSENHLVARYTGVPKMLLNYVDMLEKNPKFRVVTLYGPNVEQLFSDFAHHYKSIEAAGGLVRNEAGDILVIYRRGVWDLPKGKIDKGEKPKEAAVREVQEETGLRSVSIKVPLINTYHTYRLKSGRRVLKKTYWYIMDAEHQELIPQAEEEIEKAIWQHPRTFLGEADPIYGNIRDVVVAGFNPSLR